MPERNPSIASLRRPKCGGPPVDDRPDSSSDDRARQFDRRVGPRRGSPGATRSHDRVRGIPVGTLRGGGGRAELARTWHVYLPNTCASTCTARRSRSRIEERRQTGSLAGIQRDLEPASDEITVYALRHLPCRAGASWVKGARDSERRPDPARHQDRDYDDRRSRNLQYAKFDQEQGRRACSRMQRSPTPHTLL
jgi:hypothetical protein